MNDLFGNILVIAGILVVLSPFILVALVFLDVLLTDLKEWLDLG